MTNLLKIYIIILTLAIAGIGTYAIYEKPYQDINNITNVGAPTQKPAGLGTYYLSGSGVSSSATSVGLTKLTISQNDYAIQDSDLGSTFYMTIEPGSTSRQEFISCTTVGTNTGSTVTLSGCSRGLSPISPYTASSTLAFAHSGGSKLIFSNSPNLYDQAVFKGNDETITGTYTFTSTAIPIFDANPTITDDKHFATKKYIDDIAIAGAADATLTVKGLVEIATQTGMASTSVAGSGDTTAWLGLSAAYSTSTPDGTSYTGLYIPVSENDGYLSQLWTRLSDAYTWTGAHIFSSTVNISGTTAITGLFSSSATSTMATTTTTSFTADADSVSPMTLNDIAYTFPGAEHASSTVLSTDGSGSLSWKEEETFGTTASDTLQASADTENVSAELASGSEEFMDKRITVRLPGIVRVTYDVKTSKNDATMELRNETGGILATDTSSSATYVTKSNDIYVTAGTNIKLYFKSNTSNTQATVQNFRVKFTKSSITDTSVITD